MKRFFRAFVMALGMFSSLPCPSHLWDEDARDLMLVCLPLLGALIGLIWSLLAMLGRAFLPEALAAALIAALPFLLTGFIHLDGFMDTSDAILSWRPLQKRLEILKDSHTGSFAVVNLGLILMFGFAAAMGRFDLRALCLVPVISRCGSALCVMSLSPIGHSEYTHLKTGIAQRVAVGAMWLITMIAAILWLKTAAIALLSRFI